MLQWTKKYWSATKIWFRFILWPLKKNCGENDTHISQMSFSKYLRLMVRKQVNKKTSSIPHDSLILLLSTTNDLRSHRLIRTCNSIFAALHESFIFFDRTVHRRQPPPQNIIPKKRPCSQNSSQRDTATISLPAANVTPCDNTRTSTKSDLMKMRREMNQTHKYTNTMGDISPAERADISYAVWVIDNVRSTFRHMTNLQKLINNNVNPTQIWHHSRQFATVPRVFNLRRRAIANSHFHREETLPSSHIIPGVSCTIHARVPNHCLGYRRAHPFWRS